MTELRTIRERVARASAYFKDKDAVVLTTFNLHGAFLEEQALPITLGVDAETAPARAAELHQRLGTTSCSIFYDPTVPPKLSGRYRYVARPVPLRGRLFHPKIVVIAGNDAEGASWVYLAVSSANLTLSGWGRNVESFGETWIHTRQQQTWSALDRLLGWLQSYAPLGEKLGRNDAVVRARNILARMPDRRRLPDDAESPWSGTLYAELYSSVVNTEGLPTFLRQGHKRRPRELWAYSPYWSDVGELVDAFDAADTYLLPSMRIDGNGLGLSKEQAQGLGGRAQIHRQSGDDGARFRHMKAYWLQLGRTVLTAVGSCNFTRAGLSGERGNVEAMLVFEADPEWLGGGSLAEESELCTEAEAEEGAPEPSPISIVVAFDWRTRSWRWWLDPGPGQRHFDLVLPSGSVYAIEEGRGELSGGPPEPGAKFCVRYESNGGNQTWEGQVVELNLDHSTRVYGKPLDATQILESWRGRAPSWDLGGGSGPGEGDGDGDVPAETTAAFDAVNLYEFYRGIRALRARLSDPETSPHYQRSLLVGRPDSVWALAHLADGAAEAPIVRHLVLRELRSVFIQWIELVEADLVARVEHVADRARTVALRQLELELGDEGSNAERMLDWFEDKLASLDRRVA
ncbi:MAG: hypothetical protein H6730_28575 [Deltaproteobacteria bacterium]|nr:hypothetical protein [Deltaproteobacteria bacterium]